MTVDFNTLMSMPAKDIKRDPTIPPGTWRCRILNQKFDLRGKQKPQTNALVVNLQLREAQADINSDELRTFTEFYEGDVTKGAAEITFWMTQKALPNFTEWCMKVLRFDGEMSPREMVAKLQNQEFLGTFKQTPSTRREGEMSCFLNTDDCAPLPLVA